MTYDDERKLLDEKLERIRTLRDSGEPITPFIDGLLQENTDHYFIDMVISEFPEYRLELTRRVHATMDGISLDEEVSNAYANADDPDTAQSILGEQNSNRVFIAIALGRQHRFVEALETAARIEDVCSRNPAYHFIAEQQARAADDDAAHRTVELIELNDRDPLRRKWALEAICGQQIEAARIDKALETIHLMEQEPDRREGIIENMYFSIIIQFLKQGNYDAVSGLLQKTGDSQMSKVKQYSANILGPELMTKGDYVAARKLVCFFQDDLVCFNLPQIADAQAAEGDMVGAFETMDMTSRRYDFDSIYVCLAETSAKAGYHDNAWEARSKINKYCFMSRLTAELLLHKNSNGETLARSLQSVEEDLRPEVAKKLGNLLVRMGKTDYVESLAQTLQDQELTKQVYLGIFGTLSVNNDVIL